MFKNLFIYFVLIAFLILVSTRSYGNFIVFLCYYVENAYESVYQQRVKWAECLVYHSYLTDCKSSDATD